MRNFEQLIIPQPSNPNKTSQEEDVPQEGLLLSQIHIETPVHTVSNMATENLTAFTLPALIYYNHAISLNNKYHMH